MIECEPLPYPWWGDFKQNVMGYYLFGLMVCFAWETMWKGGNPRLPWCNRLGVGFIVLLILIGIFEIGWVNQARHPDGKYVEYCYE